MERPKVEPNVHALAHMEEGIRHVLGFLGELQP